jgi:predicted glutamine amidotransferase
MCQLIFVNTGNLILNKLAITTQLITDAKDSHKDGWGFYTPTGGLRKTQLAASLTTNVGVLIDENVKTSEPIIGHVRNASTSYGYKSVTPENSHPFQTDKLVLAHNGTLEFKDEKLMRDVKYLEMIDSEIFLTRLSDIYIPESMELRDALKSCMEEFCGKFAFLIYDKIKKDHYIVRGLTSTLFRYDLIKQDTKEYQGFIINTEEKSLLDGFFLFNNYSQLFGSRFIYDSKTVKSLDTESIYKLEGDEIRKLDSITETKKVIKSYPTTYLGWVGQDENNYKFSNQRVPLSEVENMVDILDTFIITFKIDISYLDEIFVFLFGSGILGITKENLDYFIKVIIPKFEEICRKSEYKVIKEWDKLKKEPNLLKFTAEKDIQFPYLFENYLILREIKRNQNGTTN